MIATRKIWGAVAVAMIAAACASAGSAPVTTDAPTQSLAPATAPTATSTSIPTPTASSVVAPAPPTAATTTTRITTTTAAPLPPTVRILLVGDVMLGRGVARTVATDPDRVFAGVREVIAAADIAGLNLESPLTTRPHIAINPNSLRADPASAAVLAGAGFDVAALANNHATDSGRSTVLDSIAALRAVGLSWIGAGPDRSAAFTPLIIEGGGVSVAFLSFDITLAAWPATPSRPGASHWDPSLAEPAVRAAADQAEVVVVAIHGGVEYRTRTDPTLAAIAEDLAEWGADVVWGHGPHVVQPVYVIEGALGRPVVVATSLGNFLFDMRIDGTRVGAVLGLEAGYGGVVRYRVGRAEHPDRIVEFVGWEPLEGADGDGWVHVQH